MAKRTATYTWTFRWQAQGETTGKHEQFVGSVQCHCVRQIERSGASASQGCISPSESTVESPLNYGNMSLDLAWAPPFFQNAMCVACLTEVECLSISRHFTGSITYGHPFLCRSTTYICVTDPSGAKYGLAHALQIIKKGSGGLYKHAGIKSLVRARKQ